MMETPEDNKSTFSGGCIVEPAALVFTAALGYSAGKSDALRPRNRILNSQRPLLPMSGRLRIALLCAGIALSAALLWSSAWWARQNALEEISNREANTLNLIVENLRGELGKYLFQPRLLAANPVLKTILKGRAPAAELANLNRELERINDASGALDTYLMDSQGLTVAASNWSSPRTFIGQQFAYRPYFKAAMQGQLGRYFALGSTSHQRGYYFAYPVREQDTILGVIVVKMQLDTLESSWISPEHQIAVIDYDNVIFLSSNPDWRFHTLGPIAPGVKQRLDRSRKYDQRPLPALALLQRSAPESWGRLLTIGAGDKDTTSSGNIEYLVKEVKMADAGWRVLLLASTDAVTGRVAVAVIISASALLSISLIAVVVIQRRHRFSERIRLQELARQQLEDRVQERTEELRQTQDGLIQASKLAALGQMSAGLSHELNQPLTAIRAYAENARAFLERQQLATVSQNLDGISELTARMARIIKILRTYARNEPVDIRPVSVAHCIDETLSLLDQRLRQEAIEVRYVRPPEDCCVNGGDVRLQQVLVNLVSNALDAMRGVPEKRLDISVQREEVSVVISIADSGPGIPREQLGRVFDPFFSTKEVGQGMGLGLSITYGIVKQFGGHIAAGNRNTGGAEFKLVLTAAPLQE